MRKTHAVVAVSLLLIWTLLSAGADQPFSRSRWIAERMAHVWFSGGVIPVSDQTRMAIGAIPFEPSLPALDTPPNIRVSKDIFHGDPAGAQPEMQTEPMIAANPANPNQLVAGYQDNRFSSGGARVLTYAYSQTGGKTWVERIVPKLTAAAGGPWARASDPWVAFGPGNRVYYASLAFNETNPMNGIFVSISTNGGKYFRPPVTVAATTSVFNDKEAIVVDCEPDSPHVGNVYVGWDAVAPSNNSTMLMSRSTDGGATFSTARSLGRGGENIGIIPVVGPDGTVYAIWRQLGPALNRIVISTSTNGGASWSAPSNVAGVKAAEVPFLRTGSVLQMAAVDRATGALYVVWQDKRFKNTPHVAFSRSMNGGKTWSPAKRISDGPGDAPNFTPAVAVNENGQIAVSYYSLRNDPQRALLADLYMTVSEDRGLHFQPARRISTRSFDVRFSAVADLAPGQSGFFLGDYHGIAATPQFFHPLWIATLSNSKLNPGQKQADAFTAQCRR